MGRVRHDDAHHVDGASVMSESDRDETGPTTRIDLRGLDAQTLAVAPADTVRVTFEPAGRGTGPRPTLVSPVVLRRGHSAGPVRDGRRSPAGPPAPRPAAAPPNIV